MTHQWAPISYRGFYDFPRAFVVERSGDLLFFDCQFDDDLDDYRPDFEVFKIRSEFKDKIELASWRDLRDHADRIGTVPTEAVKFDDTKRRAIDIGVFYLLDRSSDEAK